MKRASLTGLLMMAFIATILTANAAVQHFGVVTVGFGLMAPAGVYLAGFGFIIRDLIQDTARKPHLAVGAAILLGAGVAYLTGQGSLALASGAAFLLSEAADYAVYTPLRRRGYVRAALASNVIGAAVDSVVFLHIAFHSLAFLPGQVIGKLWVTAAFMVLYLPVRRAVLSRNP